MSKESEYLDSPVFKLKWAMDQQLLPGILCEAGWYLVGLMLSFIHDQNKFPFGSKAFILDRGCK